MSEPTVRAFLVDDTLPHLVIPWPECSHCGSEVTIEDGSASCPRCLVQFSRIEDGADSVPDPNEEGTEVRCEIGAKAAPPEPYEHSGRRWVVGAYLPCILPSGHEGEHLHPHTTTETALDGPR